MLRLVEAQADGGVPHIALTGGSVADAIQFANHLRKAFPQARLHVVGRSLGTGVAIQLVAQQDFSSLQLVTPYDSMLEVAKRRFPLVPLALLLRHRFDSLTHLPSSEKPHTD